MYTTNICIAMFGLDNYTAPLYLIIPPHVTIIRIDTKQDFPLRVFTELLFLFECECPKIMNQFANSQLEILLNPTKYVITFSKTHLLNKQPSQGYLQ